MYKRGTLAAVGVALALMLLVSGMAQADGRRGGGSRRSYSAVRSHGHHGSYRPSHRYSSYRPSRYYTYRPYTYYRPHTYYRPYTYYPSTYSYYGRPSVYVYYSRPSFGFSFSYGGYYYW